MARGGTGTVGVMLALGALAACGGSSSTGTGSQSTTTTTSATGASSATVSLRHVPNGQAVLSYDPATKSMNVQIHLIGLAPNSSHPAHIHTGLCEHQGVVAYPLNAVMADAKGDADSVTAVPNVKEGRIPDATWYVNIHNGPTLTPDEQFQPIVCGDVANANRANTVRVILASGPAPPSLPGSPDQAASGTATLNVTGGTLNVSIDATGLAPSSSHAVHLHLGQCASQGTVVHPLPTLTADANGHATLTASVPNVASIPLGTWYLNVHRTVTVGTGQTDFDPILCGDVGGASGY
jgi:hypothetical protein